MTTFYSYGEVGNRRQGEIIRGLGTPQHIVPPDVTELAKAVVRELRESERPSYPVKNEGHEIGASIDQAVGAHLGAHGLSLYINQFIINKLTHVYE